MKWNPLESVIHPMVPEHMTKGRSSWKRTREVLKRWAEEKLPSEWKKIERFHRKWIKMPKVWARGGEPVRCRWRMCSCNSLRNTCAKDDRDYGWTRCSDEDTWSGDHENFQAQEFDAGVSTYPKHKSVQDDSRRSNMVVVEEDTKLPWFLCNFKCLEASWRLLWQRNEIPFSLRFCFFK